jgi:hypothetical protein
LFGIGAAVIRDLREVLFLLRVKRTFLFGSILTPRFREEGDIDMLVEFLPGEGPGLLASRGWKSSCPKCSAARWTCAHRSLSCYFRDEVVASPVPQYEQG